jgi:hypothetical protein
VAAVRIGQTRWRSLRGWFLLAFSIVLGGSVGAASAVWLSGPAAAAVGSTLAAAVFGAVSARAKTLLDRQDEYTGALPEQLVGVGDPGRPLRVRDHNNPILLRVHPAEALQRTVDDVLVADQVPPYVPRDAQQGLWDAVSRSGFVLVAGDSTAGKTRVAYEAIRAVLPDHVLIAPIDRDALTAAVAVALEQRRSVVWLDDLERFFGHHGLTALTVSRILSDDNRHALVLATMRSAEFDRFSAREESRFAGAERDSWREAYDVLKLAAVVELPRRWSAQELQRARSYNNDPRIAAALGKTSQFGLAEVLAAGPQLARDWRNAWRTGAHPRGAALVAAAVDCRRAGVHTPQPLDLLTELAEHYLNEQGGPLLRPEPLDDALAWATTPSHGTSSLLLPSERANHYLAFDYLVDLPGLDRIPQTTWDTLITHASPRQSFEIGEAARQRFQFHTAVAAFRKADDHHVPDADLAMAQVLGRSSNDYQERVASIRILTAASAQHEQHLGALAPTTLRARLSLAERLADGHDPIHAAELLSTLINDLEHVLGPDHHDTLAARRWYAYALGQTGDMRCLQLLESVLFDHERTLGRNHHDTLLTRHYIAVYTMGEAPWQAIELLEKVTADYERVLGSDSPRVLQSRTLLAEAHGYIGNTLQAATALQELVQDRQRILGPRHLHTLRSRFSLVHWVARAGDRSRAVELFHELLNDWQQAVTSGSAIGEIARSITKNFAGNWIYLTKRQRKDIADNLWTCRHLLGVEHALTKEVQRLYEFSQMSSE